MHVISQKRIREAQNSFPAAASALRGWYRIVSQNKINNFSELRKIFNSVDRVAHLYVFDIGGNKLRLIASIHFNRQKIYIRHILTHVSYEKGQWKREGEICDSRKLN